MLQRSNLTQCGMCHTVFRPYICKAYSVQLHCSNYVPPWCCHGSSISTNPPLLQNSWFLDCEKIKIDSTAGAVEANLY